MSLHPEDLRRVSWACVHFADAAPDTAGLEADGFAVRRMDAATGPLLGGLADALSFPDYFGNNWDAADECLRDLDWLPASGYVLVVAGAGELWRASPQSAAELVDAWLVAAESWAHDGTPFHLVFEW